MPKDELLDKFRNLEYAHQRLIEDAKKQQRELASRLSAANSKHAKAVSKTKALDAENRALKKHIREAEYSSTSTPVPKISLKGHAKARLQIMRGTQTRVRDWSYLQLPIGPDGNRVGEIIFSEDEAEELKVMKDRRGGLGGASGRGKGKGAAAKKRKVEEPATQDAATLQAQMLAEAERVVQIKATTEERETVMVTTTTASAHGRITIIEDDVPQPEKVVEIQATPTAPAAVKRPAFFPKTTIPIKTEPTAAVNNTQTVMVTQQQHQPQRQQQQMVQTAPASVLATAQQQQHVIQQQQQSQQHQLQQQHHVVAATPTVQMVTTPASTAASSLGQQTTTIQIPASALTSLGQHGHQLLTVHQAQPQQLQQHHADPQQPQQQVVYLLNAPEAGTEFVTTASTGEIVVKDGKTWAI